MLATTFGQGAFAINMAPMLFPSTVELDPGSVSGTAPDGTPLVTTSQPVFDGLSEITGSGMRPGSRSSTRHRAIRPSVRSSAGLIRSNVAGTNVAANWTNSFGRFLGRRQRR